MNKDVEIFLDSGLLQAYALDDCNRAERAEVEYFLAVSDKVRLEYEELQADMERLAMSHAQTVPASWKRDILAFLRESDEPLLVPMTGSERKQDPVKIWAVAASVAFLVAFLAWMRSDGLNGTLSDELARAELELSELRRADEAKGMILANLNEQLDLIRLPDAEKRVLVGNDRSPELRLVSYWNPEAKRHFLDLSQVPSPPDGHSYQLWADVHGEMVSVAILDELEAEFASVAFMPEAESLNITIEPAGGSDHATVSELVASVPI